MYKFDLVTLLMYCIIGLFCCVLIYQSNRKFAYANGRLVHNIKKNRYVWCFVVLLSLIATVRSVDVGTDTVTYELMFVNASDSMELARVEMLFVRFTKFIRLFTSNFRVYLFICYSIIACAYIVFIKSFLQKNTSYIPFILVIFPFLNSLNTMRSSLAIAIFLLGLSLMKTKKIRGFLIIVCSVFVHRMMVAFVFLPVFNFLFGKQITKKNKVALLVFISVLSVILFLLVSLLKEIVIRFDLIKGTDFAYLNLSSRGDLLLKNYVTLFPYFLLLIVICLFGHKLNKSKESMTIKSFCVYDIIVAIPALSIGLWRINEVMYLGRLIMWGVLIDIVIHKTNIKSSAFLKVFIFLLFVAWLIFRIVSIYYDAGLMPFSLWFN